MYYIKLKVEGLYSYEARNAKEIKDFFIHQFYQNKDNDIFLLEKKGITIECRKVDVKRLNTKIKKLQNRIEKLKNQTNQ